MKNKDRLRNVPDERDLTNIMCEPVYSFVIKDIIRTVGKICLKSAD